MDNNSQEEELKHIDQSNVDLRTSNSFSTLFFNFCDRSTIHGAKYVGERNRPYIEKFIWILVVFISISVAVFNSINIWKTWQQTPTIVTLNEQNVETYNYPFPAITICPQIKYRHGHFNFTNYFQYLMNTNDENNNITTTHEMREYFLSLLQVCDIETVAFFINNSINSFSSKNSEELDQLNKLETSLQRDRIIEILKTIAPPENEIFDLSFWNFKDIQNNFIEVLTDEGISYTLNGLARDFIEKKSITLNTKPNLFTEYVHRINWSLENGYVNDSVYPLRMIGMGSNNGVSLLLKAKKDDIDYFCSGPIQGFKIALHSPDEIPKIKNDFVFIPLNQIVLVSVLPTVMVTSNELKKYSAKSRKCFYSYERNLTYYNIYNQKNCEQECYRKVLKETYNCTPLDVNSTEPVCPLNDMAYLDSPEKFHRIYSEFLIECNCLPACNTLSYDTRISAAGFNVESYAQIHDSGISDKYYYSEVKIFPRKNEIIPGKRIELYGISSFLSKCGGIFSLFMGTSFISIIEIIYFFCIKSFLEKRNPNNIVPN